MAAFICTHCGWEGERKSAMRGSRGMEIFIWTVLLIPGPLYSFWRRTGRSRECPHCHLPMLAKLESTDGKLARRRFDVELGLIAPSTTVKEEKKETVREVFGNERSAVQGEKKPVDPEKW